VFVLVSGVVTSVSSLVPLILPTEKINTVTPSVTVMLDIPPLMENVFVKDIGSITNVLPLVQPIPQEPLLMERPFVFVIPTSH